MKTKTTVREALDRLPDDCTLEDVIDHLDLIARVERGLADADAGRTISHEEAKNLLLDRWDATESAESTIPAWHRRELDRRLADPNPQLLSRREFEARIAQPDEGPARVELADTSETDRRKREIQILVNVIQPDPEYQPFLVAGEAGPLDVSPAPVEEIQTRLEAYLGRPLPIPVTASLASLVDAIRAEDPEWPESAQNSWFYPSDSDSSLNSDTESTNA